MWFIKAGKQKTFDDYLLDKPGAITPELLDHYEAHPEELDMLVNREVIQTGILKYFLWSSLLLIGGSRVLIYYFQQELPGFVSDVLLEMSFEVGNAILGGVLAAFLIERLQKKQYVQNVRYRRAIQVKLEKRKTSECTSPKIRSENDEIGWNGWLNIEYLTYSKRACYA